MHEAIKDWERRVDEMLMEEGVELGSLHTTCEQNGSEVEEEQLVYGWFANLERE